MQEDPIRKAADAAGEEKRQAIIFAWKMRELLGPARKDDEHYIRVQGALNKLVEEAEIVNNEINLMQEKQGFLMMA